MDSTAPGLQKRLGLFTIICISAGAVLGGWLAEAPYWFEVTGAGAAFLFPILAILLLPIAFAFAEQTSMLPFSSTVGTWLGNSMGGFVGWIAQWLFFLVQVVEPPLVAYIFSTALTYVFPETKQHQTLIAIGIMLVWYVFSNFNVELTGRLAVIFFIAMTTITLIVSGYYMLAGHWTLSNVTDHGGFFPNGGWGAVIGCSVLVLKYIGLELPPTLVQDSKFPPRKMVLAILAGLFVPAIIYFIATMALGGLAPHQVIAGLAMPGPELTDSLGMLHVFAVLDIIAGLLFAFTTLMGFWTSSARVLYGASQLHQLPRGFLRTNRHGQPWIANILVLIFSVFFALFSGTNWIQYMYTLSILAAGVVYLLVCLSAIILRVRHPEWERPFKMPAGILVYSLGVIISLIIVAIGVTELPAEAVFPITVYILLGLAIPLGMKWYRAKNADWTPVILSPSDAK
ncbi:APC family permease [Helcobacillus massiliensis]|uniref:APC family permease n=1 Tax=Helcobacillus massiliensis TaxID=521392 RepID=UPI0025537AFA|nr:APC family permease [Helcobacillus massiliensis]MDK7741562.1 APC family permease [Helcobacillus massiliensis]WOO92608.1 APC family permease [Helcobacillus massiliensis]